MCQVYEYPLEYIIYSLVKSMFKMFFKDGIPTDGYFEYVAEASSTLPP